MASPMSDEIDWNGIHALDVEDGEIVTGISDEIPDDFEQARSVPGEHFFDTPDDIPASATDEPDAGMLKKPTRPRGAIKYEGKVTSLLQVATQLSLNSPVTLPDAAALLMHGPDLAEKMGNLAATDARIARAIDMLTEGTENPYLSVTMAAFPLVLQILRNHEPVAEVNPDSKGFKIPGIKRPIKIRFGVKLGRLRNVTNDPDALTNSVFSNPGILAALEKQGLTANVASSLTRRQRRAARKAQS